MYAFISGKVFSKSIDSVVINNNGIGYRLFVSNPNDYPTNEDVFVYTYQQVREDGIFLFGFKSLNEHDLFIRLISVKGMGPKTALGVLSVGTVDYIISAIESGDVNLLKKLPGIGAKTAQQVILDLKGKLVLSEDVNTKVDNPELNDAIDALKNLGYKPNEIKKVVNEIAKEELTTQQYLRKALQMLNK